VITDTVTDSEFWLHSGKEVLGTKMEVSKEQCGGIRTDLNECIKESQ
jgi:hypothetical protein